MTIWPRWNQEKYSVLTLSRPPDVPISRFHGQPLGRPGFFADQMLDAFEIRNHRRLVEHAHAANDRAAFAEGVIGIGLDDIGIRAHELRKALCDNAKVSGGQLFADGDKYCDTGASARR